MKKKKIVEKFRGGVGDFLWRCGECKRRTYPDIYCQNLRCPYCGSWGMERHAKKGKWVLTI